jgi:hypothetical protein
LFRVSNKSGKPVIIQQAKDLTDLIYKNIDYDQDGKITKADMDTFFKNKKDADYAFTLFDEVNILYQSLNSN